MAKKENSKMPLALKIIASWMIIAGILRILIEELYILPGTIIFYIVEVLFIEPLLFIFAIPIWLLDSVESDSYFILFTLPAILGLILLAVLAFLLIKKYKAAKPILLGSAYLSVILTLLSPWGCMLQCTDAEHYWWITLLVPRLIINILIAGILTYFLFFNKKIKEYFNK